MLSVGVRPTRFYYGWLIVAAAFLASFVAPAMIGTTVFGVLLKPMTDDLGWTRTQMVAAVTVGGLVGGVISPIIGRIVDQSGPRLLMVVSGIVGGLILIAISRIGDLWQWYALFGIGVAISRAGVSGIVPSTALANWFIQKRGRATAFASMGISLGNTLLAPFATYLVINFGWRFTWIVLGCLVMLFTTVPSGIFMRRRPEDMGLRPDGATGLPAPSNGRSPSGRGRGAKSDLSWTTGEALRTKAFWLVLMASVVNGFSLSSVILHMVPFMTDSGLSPAVTAAAVSLFGVSALITKPFWGFLVERFHIRYGVIMNDLFLAIAIILLITTVPLGMPYFFPVAAGIGFAGSAVVNTIVLADYFGRESIGTIRGLASPFQVISSAGGPLLAAWLYDTTGTYGPVFTFYIFAHIIAMILMIIARPPQLPVRLRRVAEVFPVVAAGQ